MATNQNKTGSGNTGHSGLNPKIQEFKLKGGQVLDKVKEIIEDGNARRVIIRSGDRTLLEFPLAVGVGGAAAALLLAPTLAAIGAIAALLTDVSIIVERDADGDGVAEESTTLLAGKGGKASSGSASSTGSTSSKGTSSGSSSGSSSSGSTSSGSGSGKTMGSEAK
jgi:hypothetical protein